MIFIVGTFHSESTLLHGSAVGPEDCAASVKVAVGMAGSTVGVKVAVSVGSGVEVKVAVGGRGVSVGTAA